MRAPGLVDDERGAGRVRDLGAAGHVGGDPVVGRRHDERGPRVGRARERRRERVGRDAVGHAELLVVLGRHEAGTPPESTRPSISERVRVALHDDRGPGRRSARQSAWLPWVAPLVRNHVRARRSASAASARRGRRAWGGPRSIPSMSWGDVERQRRVADRRGAGPGRRPGRPCARGRGSGWTAERVGGQRVQVRRASAARRAAGSRLVESSLRRLLEQVGAHEVVEVAVEHALDVAHLDAGAQVLDLRVGVQDVGADLRAEVHVLRLAALAGDLLAALALLLLGELRAQHGHGRRPCWRTASARSGTGRRCPSGGG